MVLMLSDCLTLPTVTDASGGSGGNSGGSNIGGIYTGPVNGSPIGGGSYDPRTGGGSGDPVSGQDLPSLGFYDDPYNVYWASFNSLAGNGINNEPLAFTQADADAYANQIGRYWENPSYDDFLSSSYDP
ncbi:MAG TPA: hypothetical protein VG842_00545, partial [Sediminibacterium sp.]|nr:hypothetical protein [Sediminibacterium sp.]